MDQTADIAGALLQGQADTIFRRIALSPAFREATGLDLRVDRYGLPRAELVKAIQAAVQGQDAAVTDFSGTVAHLRLEEGRIVICRQAADGTESRLIQGDLQFLSPDPAIRHGAFLELAAQFGATGPRADDWLPLLEERRATPEELDRLYDEMRASLHQWWVPDLDLWVLVATTEIGSNTLDEVSRLANEHAVEMLVVDTRPDGGGDTLPALRAYHERNRWARHWYRQFLTASDKDESHAGFVLFLRCADRRCRLWMAEMEAKLAEEPGFNEWRIRYRLTIDDTITKAISENEKARADKLFGLEFKKDEVIPYGLWLAPDIQIPAPRA